MHGVDPSVPKLLHVPGIGQISNSTAFAYPVLGRRGTPRQVLKTDIKLFLLICVVGLVPQNVVTTGEVAQVVVYTFGDCWPKVCYCLF